MKNLLFLFTIPVLLTFFRAPAAGNEIHSMYAGDFNLADAVVLVAVQHCTITDTMGQYTTQKLTGRIITCYKGCTLFTGDSIVFYAGVETHRQWLEAGSIHGFFLEQYRDGFSWIENSGFLTTDTAFIRTLTRKEVLYDSVVTALMMPDEGPQWSRAMLEDLRWHKQPGGDSGLRAKIRIVETVNEHRLSKGKSYIIDIESPAFGMTHFLRDIKAGRAYYFPVYKAEKGYYAPVAAVVPQISPGLLKRLKTGKLY